jgi:hypothetical protein
MADPKPIAPQQPIPKPSVDHDFATKGGGAGKEVVRPARVIIRPIKK